VDCDLRSSQFAILAAKLNAPISQAFIASGESIWRELYRYLSGVDAAPPPETKKVLKEAMYSLCFGKGERKLRALLDPFRIAKVLRHPIFHELLMLRREWFEQIGKAGGAPDVWGQWHLIDNRIDPATGKTKRWAGAIGGTVIQSIEMEIIAPIFDVATVAWRRC
jgi:hypothetical protein